MACTTFDLNLVVFFKLLITVCRPRC